MRPSSRICNKTRQRLIVAPPLADTTHAVCVCDLKWEDDVVVDGGCGHEKVVREGRGLAAGATVIWTCRRAG